MVNNSPGLWICLDGPDFTGKGTQTKELFTRLVSANEDNVITYTHEPTRDARAIKEKLKREKGDAYKGPMVMAELYIDNRAVNELQVVRPALLAGGIVISNRHKYSTLAYQLAQGVSLQELTRMHKERGIGTPDITFFLFLDNEKELRERMLRTGKTGDKFESDFEFQRKVATNYRHLAELAGEDLDFFGDIHSVNMHPGTGIHDISRSIWKNLEPVYNAWTKKRDQI